MLLSSRSGELERGNRWYAIALQTGLEKTGRIVPALRIPKLPSALSHELVSELERVRANRVLVDYSVPPCGQPRQCVFGVTLGLYTLTSPEWSACASC